MSLDRRSIEKRDFPLRWRGYDRVAVDAHLRAIADELEGGLLPTADAAAEQVRAVIAAAEASAAQIVARAEAQAQQIAGAGRADRVTAAAGGALERIEALRAELAELLAALGEAEEVPAPADEAGAKLVAFDLALSGTPREQAGRVLAEHFALADGRALLDDVYAAAGR